MANVSDFKSRMTGGGARANQFKVFLSFPQYVGLGALAGAEAQFLCNAAQLPGSTIDPVTVQYHGRPVNFAGERTFAPWNITVYNDTNFVIRNALEQWSNGIQNIGSTTGLTNPSDYQVDLEVHQLDRAGNPLKIYKFVDAFPTDIGAIQLSYDTTGAIESFDTTFTYNYWESNTSTPAGSGVNININTPVGTVNFPI